MEAHTELAKAKLAHGLFAFFDNGEALGCDFDSISDPRGEAGGGWSVPHGQINLAGKFTNISLGHAGIEQRSQNLVLAGGLLPGTPIAEIVLVDSIRHRSDPALACQAVKLIEKFILAVVAAVGVVGAIGGIREFIGRDKLVAEISVGNALLRFFAVARRVAGAQGRNR